jgi:hypothetical protein
MRLRPHDTDNFVFMRLTPYPAVMSRGLFFLVLAFTLLFPRLLPAQDEPPHDDGPPISITSPDAGTTYAFGTIKTHQLYWNKNLKMLMAQFTFTDAEQNFGTSNDDTHVFRLPGISFDEAKGVFFAVTVKGEKIPVAHFKKTLFIKSVETLPNAVVRILHPRGVITVILEAISPDDPAMHPPADNSDPNASHKVDINNILN